MGKDDAAVAREAERVLNYLASEPTYGRTTVTREVLRYIQLTQNAELSARGRLHDICQRSVGAGIYKVWLRERKSPNGQG